MKQSNKDLSKVFFNSIEEMNECYGIDAELPSNLHSNADLVCYEIVEPFVHEYLAQYVFTKFGFRHLNNLGDVGSNAINKIRSESEVCGYDMDNYEGRCFVYVRVNEYLRKHLEKTLIGCEFVNKYGYKFDSKRKFIHSVGDVFCVGDQDGFVSSVNNIALYLDDYSDPIPYKEWVKKINEQDVED